MLQEKFFNTVDYYLPDLRHRVKQANLGILRWCREIIQQLITLLIQFVTVFLAYAILLLYVNYLWIFYKDTQVGYYFVKNYSGSHFFSVLLELNQNLLYLSFRSTLDVLINCLLIGLAVQALAIRRYFYDGHGMLHRICWVITLTAITASNIFDFNYPLTFYSGIVLYFIPVCFLLGTCLKFTAKCAPEISLGAQIINDLKEVVRVARIRNAMRNIDE